MLLQGDSSLLAWRNPDGQEVVDILDGNFEWVKQPVTPVSTIPIPLHALLLIM